jgi:hypothetical protein
VSDRADHDLVATSGGYLPIAIIGIVFVSVGVAMMLDVRGFGGRIVAIMASMATVLGSGPQARKVLAHRRFFRLAWGLLAGCFGVGALLISVLH